MLSLQKQLTIALDIANKKHAKQKDKGKQPYILHPLAVMNRVETLEQKIAAILHDIVEDTDVTLNELQNLGISKEIITIIDCVTKREEETYVEYLQRILSNNDAIEVKLADLEENKNLYRLQVVTDIDLLRCNFYSTAFFYLKQYDKMSRELKVEFENSMENILNKIKNMKKS